MPDEKIGINYKDHAVNLDRCVSDLSKNVTELAMSNLEGIHSTAATSLLDDSYKPAFWIIVISVQSLITKISLLDRVREVINHFCSMY